MEILVLGGSYAGLNAAIRASRVVGDRGRVRLVTEGTKFFERIRLHELASHETPVEADLEGLLEGTGVELTVARVERLDLATKRVVTKASAIGFDRLVVALGSRTSRSIPGAERFAHALDDPRGTAVLRHALLRLSDAGGGEVLVIGGGLTAIEAAAEIAEAMPRLRVRIASMAPIADELSRTARTYLSRRLSEMGVSVTEGTRIVEIEEGRARTDRDASIDFGVCIVASGFTASPIARLSGLEVGRNGQMRTDASLRSVSHPFVYGVGDIAMPTTDLGGPIVMACRTATPMAAHAADALGCELEGKPPLPMRFADSVRCISLGRHDGLVTIHRPNGVPTEHVITGRAGAFIKEGICRYTVTRIRAEAFRARLRRTEVVEPRPRKAERARAEGPH